MKTVLLITLLLLGGCSTALTGIPTNTYQALPQLPIPEDPNIIPIQYDVPRDTNGTPVKNSNIFIGYNEQGWNDKQINDERLRTYIFLLRLAIDSENERRAKMQEKGKTDKSGK